MEEKGSPREQAHFNIHGNLFYQHLEQKNSEGLLILLIGEFRSLAETSKLKFEEISSRLRVVENRVGMLESKVSECNRNMLIQSSAIVRMTQALPRSGASTGGSAEDEEPDDGRPKTARPSRSTSMRVPRHTRRRNTNSAPFAGAPPLQRTQSMEEDLRPLANKSAGLIAVQKNE